MARAAPTQQAPPIDLGAASAEIVPLSPDRWLDVAALFDDGGDPKSCSCMFWRVRSKDWSFRGGAEARDGFRTLVDEARDPAPRLLAYAATVCRIHRPAGRLTAQSSAGGRRT